MQIIRICGILLSLLIAGALARSQTISINLSATQQARQSLTVTGIGRLAAGGRQRFSVRLARAESLELRAPFSAAPFNGTQLNATVNGRRMLPYFAFGGDTRYDAVQGKPGMRPPVATIEGRWIIPADWLRQGNNELVLWTSGVRKDAALARLGPKPEIRIGGITLGALDGADLPNYSNTVYYDFNVWAQGYPFGDEPNRLNNDLALLGVINGKGMPCVNPSLGGPESSLWGWKRTCEDNALGWGMGHQEFYTIWELADKPQLWAEFRDVDNNPETTTTFHSQTVFASRTPKGADIVLYDPAKYAAIMEPGIRFLAPYTDFYNYSCEQEGPAGQGFGVDGERWKDYGIHGDLWARNHYEANKAANDLVRKYNPAGGTQEINHWRRGVRTILYDTALERGQPMRDIVDILMVHFDLVDEYDRGPDGLDSKENAFNKQYPYPGATERQGGNEGFIGNRFPEQALDLNRYRLSRSEKDMIFGDPKVNRWGNGRPFDFRAGFRGDEMMYNSENGIWGTGYAGPTPYQFLHGFFSYSLLPTGASEPRDLKIITRSSPTDTKELPVRRYGEWVNGAGGTKRLRTVDPLYGDMFGWTGQEYCNFGDYISMVGIKEPHHRLPGADAFGLVRRTCYAFVTSGPVVPALLNPGSSDQLFVKALVQTFDHRQYIGLYAANFTDKAQALDVTLPVALPAGAVASVYTDRAWDWRASAKPLALPAGEDFRYQTQIPALGAWLVLIPVTDDVIAGAFGLPAPPTPLAPALDGAVSEGLPSFKWTPARQSRFTVEIAREALFRPQDRVEIAEGVPEASYTMREAPAERWRYFWRVRAVDGEGKGGLWSAPRAFVYRWEEYSKAFPPREAAGAPAQFAVNRPDDPGNLAWQGEIWGTGGSMNSPTRAIDGQEFSFWANEGSSKDGKPAEWCVIWPQSASLRSVEIRWNEELPPLEFALQVSDDGKTWTDLLKKAGDIETLTELTLPKPASARYLRILITRMRDEGGNVGIREVMVR